MFSIRFSPAMLRMVSCAICFSKRFALCHAVVPDQRFLIRLEFFLLEGGARFNSGGDAVEESGDLMDSFEHGDQPISRCGEGEVGTPKVPILPKHRSLWGEFVNHADLADKINRAREWGFAGRADCSTAQSFQQVSRLSFPGSWAS